MTTIPQNLLLARTRWFRLHSLDAQLWYNLLGHNRDVYTSFFKFRIKATKGGLAKNAFHLFLYISFPHLTALLNAVYIKLVIAKSTLNNIVEIRLSIKPLKRGGFKVFNILSSG